MIEYKKNILFLTFVLLCTVLPKSIQSQERAYNTFLKDSLGVGENVDLYITFDQKDYPNVNEIDLSTLVDMNFYPPVQNQGDSIKKTKADIAINDYGLWNDDDGDGLLQGSEIAWEKIENGDTVLYRNKINLSFFDVGLYVFDGFKITMDGQIMNTNRISLMVTFKEYDLEVVDSTGLAPIKDIDREYLNFSDALPYLGGLFGIAALVFGIFYFIKKRKKEEKIEEEEVIILPPDVKALIALKDLRGKELWQKGEIKEYQSELSHIIRQYLEERYNIHALESTTNQIIRSIKDSSFEENDQNMLKRILQISDLVKFAKARPEVNIHEEFMNDAVTFVERTKVIKIENEEEE